MDNVKIYTKEGLIERFHEIAAMGWIPSGRNGNAGGVGNTLEDLLGIEENNLPIPNASEWELKAQRLNTSSLVTLFHMEPSPSALKFVPQIFLLKYGWAHKEAGKKYPSTEMSFRQTIHGMSPSDRGFMVKIDRDERKVIISFDADAIDKRHEEWKKQVEQRVGLRQLAPQPYWGFDDLEHKAATKLHNCFFVQADCKKEDGIEYYKYTSVTMLRGFNFEGFLHGLETGKILVDFDARTGHNHGTKFRMKQNYFPNLYAENRVIL